MGERGVKEVKGNEGHGIRLNSRICLRVVSLVRLLGLGIRIRSMIIRPLCS